VRYRFHRRNLADFLIDLPLALRAAVARIALTELFASRGGIGVCLALIGIEMDQTSLGILAALIFVGLPSGVRRLDPVTTDLPILPGAVLSTAGRTVRPRRRDTLSHKYMLICLDSPFGTWSRGGVEVLHVGFVVELRGKPV